MAFISGRKLWQYLFYFGLCFFVNKIAGTCEGPDNFCSSLQCPLEYVYEFAHTDKDPERQLAYFREDVALGASHLNFHHAYPFWTTLNNTVMDRVGEIFYYYHQQITARFDAERFSMGFPKVIPYEDFLKPIEEGYVPNYPPLTTKRNYHSRLANMTISDVPGKSLKVSNFILWNDRLKEAVRDGYIKHHNGTKIPIISEAGLNLLVLVSESTIDAPNHKYYGCYHTYFHLLGAKIGDPNEEYYNGFEIMADFALNVMDPLFYRYHKYFVELFVSLKVKLDEYKRDEVLFKILQHEEFVYNLDVENLSDQNERATIRIFLAPVHDNNGRELSLQEQRTLFIELDKFKVTLKPGSQTITRHSTQSSVTIPLEKTTDIFATSPVQDTGRLDIAKDYCVWPHRFMDQSEERENFDVSDEFSQPLTAKIAHNNCGWPHHLLIPKGKKGGMSFVLFAMLSDWHQDKVRSHPEQDFVQGSAYCGIFNDTYPDKRAMGYPFDRQISDGATIDDFLQPNMAATIIKIHHSDQIVPLDGTFETMKE